MDETQTLAAQALRELLDNPDRDDWDELLAANRAVNWTILFGRLADAGSGAFVCGPSSYRMMDAG